MFVVPAGLKVIYYCACLIGSTIGLSIMMADIIKFSTQKLVPINVMVEDSDCDVMNNICIIYVSYFVNSIPYQSFFKGNPTFKKGNVTVCYNINTPSVVYNAYKPSTDTCGLDTNYIVLKLCFVIVFTVLTILSAIFTKRSWRLHKRQHRNFNNMNREIELGL